MSFDLKIENGNLALNNGDLRQVTDGDKLEQDVLKVSLTDAGANPLHPWYGSFITRNIVGTAQDIELLNSIGQSQLQSALENLKKLQELQLGSFQRMTADEQLLSILSVTVVRNPYDPRQIDVTINILTKGRKPLTTSFQVSTA